jgi:hypothetical protein
LVSGFDSVFVVESVLGLESELVLSPSDFSFARLRVP